MACTCYKRCRHSLTVKLHPDGKHGKRFDIPHWLSARGFALKESHGTTGYCGTYVRCKQVIPVTSIPGRGDGWRRPTKGRSLRNVKAESLTHGMPARHHVCARGSAKRSACLWPAPKPGVRSPWCRRPKRRSGWHKGWLLGQKRLEWRLPWLMN